jgi:hypothetical protein
LLITCAIIGTAFTYVWAKHRRHGSALAARAAGFGGGFGAAAAAAPRSAPIGARAPHGIVPGMPVNAATVSAPPATSGVPRTGGYRLGSAPTVSAPPASAPSLSSAAAMSPRTAARLGRPLARPPASDGHMPLNDEV